MKSIKLIFAVLLLCVSQFAMAAPTPAQQAAISAALGSGPGYTQAQVDAAVQAAANHGVALADLVAYLAGSPVSVPGLLITKALESNINAGISAGGEQASCAPNCGPVSENVSYSADDAAEINALLAAYGISSSVSVVSAGPGGDGTPGGQMGGAFGAAFGGNFGGTFGTGAGVGGPSGPVSPN